MEQRLSLVTLGVADLTRACSCYFADPDGHPWEVAWNPSWAIDTAGHVSLVRA